MPKRLRKALVGACCKACNKLLINYQVIYCSQSCKNRIVKQTPISGYKNCLWCKYSFPFRFSAKKRSAFCKRLGMLVASPKQMYCSRYCSMKYRNFLQNPMKNKSNVEKISGENNYAWKGGIVSRGKHIIGSSEYKKWVRNVFVRDDYTCQDCGARGGKLVADHELPWSFFPDLRFELLNGRTFCQECHKKTLTYAGRVITFAKQMEWQIPPFAT